MSEIALQARGKQEEIYKSRGLHKASITPEHMRPGNF